MPQLFDLSGADDRTLNYHLECLCKAQAEPHDPPGGKGDMWEPHPSVFLQQLVEAFTSLGVKVTDDLKAELFSWLAGGVHGAGAPAHPSHPLLLGHGPHNGGSGATGGGSGAGGGQPPVPPSGGWPIVPAVSWTPETVAAARAYLLAKPLASWTVDDFLLLVDVLAQSHFPPGWAEQQAEWLSTRSGLMAKVEDLAPGASLAQVGNVLAAMPNTLAEALAGELQLRPAHVAAMAFGRARAAENIRNVNDALRHALKSSILASLEEGFAVAGGAPALPSQALTQRLFDDFAQHNRDWRRIAVTEAGEIKNQGFVGLQDPGEFLRRVERYRGACTFCRNLDGRVFKVVDPLDPDKDGQKEIWAGKTNVGRSASPRKRVDGELVDRLPSELWWAAAGVQHPHCRGVWVRVKPPVPTSSDKAWKEWLAHLGVDFGGS